MSDYLERMKVEHGELSERIDKLRNFMITGGWDKLEKEDKINLMDQEHHMSEYSRILLRRIVRANRYGK